MPTASDLISRRFPSGLRVTDRREIGATAGAGNFTMTGNANIAGSTSPVIRRRSKAPVHCERCGRSVRVPRRYVEKSLYGRYSTQLYSTETGPTLCRHCAPRCSSDYIKKNECKVCGRFFYTSDGGRETHTCGPRCRNARFRDTARYRRLPVLATEEIRSEFLSEYYGEDIYHTREYRGRRPVECAGCQVSFTPLRKDTSYCTNACKQRAYRRRQ